MIYLLRHGLDDEKFVGGWSNVDLTEYGIKQINDIGKYLIAHNIKIDKIYTSDIKRAVTTANIISKYLNVEVIFLPNLRELDKGLLTGLNVSLAKEKFPDYFENVTIDTRYPNGESLTDLYERTKVLLNSQILSEKNILIVTHRGIINMIYTILRNDIIDTNKEKYGVTHASLHQLDIQKKLINKIKN